MPVGNLNRYFQLGARCLTCEWRGTVGALVSRGSAPATSPLHCPKCDGQQTEWPLATHDAHETAQ